MTWLRTQICQLNRLMMHLRSRALTWIVDVNIPILVFRVVVLLRVLYIVSHVARSGDLDCVFGLRVRFEASAKPCNRFIWRYEDVQLHLSYALYIMFNIISDSNVTFINRTLYANDAGPHSTARIHYTNCVIAWSICSCRY